MTSPQSSVRLAILLAAISLTAGVPSARAQQPLTDTAKLSGRVALPLVDVKSHSPTIVVWLTQVGKSSLLAPPPGRFSLIQKNRMFKPHLLVVPVGSVISFPNQDPFFHNVFSMFNGKRFDLGLYEAGSSREVTFSREGVSYIFCNIHPEMSAVVLALSTSLYSVADPSGKFSIHAVAPGVYELHVWIESAPQPDLDRLNRRIVLKEGESTEISIDASSAYRAIHDHLNMFGKPYPPQSRSPY